ncbi:hypothetical protein [Streptomyces sp. NPDC005374]
MAADRAAWQAADARLAARIRAVHPEAVVARTSLITGDKAVV